MNVVRDGDEFESPGRPGGRVGRGGRGAPGRRRHADAAGTQRAAVGAGRRRGLAQARGPAAGPLLQAARRLQPDGPARRRQRRRRGLRQRRQPRPGGRLRLRRAGDPAAGSTCRGRRRGRSASGSRRIGGALGRHRDRRRHLRRCRRGRRRRRRARRGARLVPAFDDLRTIAGQGTVAVEIVEQLGARAGPAGHPGRRWRPARRRRRLARRAAPRGRASSGSSRSVPRACRRPWRPAGRSTLAELDTFVDGAAVRRVGDVTFPLVRDAGAERRSSLEPGAICTEMLELYQTDGIIAEPAGALATPPSASRGHPRRARPSSASSRAATTTSAATPRSSSARWSAKGSSTTS